MLIKPEGLREMLTLAGKALLKMSPKDEDIDQWAERLARDLVAAGEKEYEQMKPVKCRDCEKEMAEVSDELQEATGLCPECMFTRLEESEKNIPDLPFNGDDDL